MYSYCQIYYFRFIAYTIPFKFIFFQSCTYFLFQKQIEILKYSYPSDKSQDNVDYKISK